MGVSNSLVSVDESSYTATPIWTPGSCAPSWSVEIMKARSVKKSADAPATEISISFMNILPMTSRARGYRNAVRMLCYGEKNKKFFVNNINIYKLSSRTE